MITVRALLLLIALVGQQSNLSAEFSVEKGKTLSVALLSSVDLRKNQREDIEKNLVALKKRYDDAQKYITQTLDRIVIELVETQQKLKSARDQEADFYNRKVAFLNDRKQNFFDYKDLWKERIDVCERHIKLLDEIIQFLQPSHIELKPAYSWKEFRDLQIRISEHSIKIQNDKARRENTKKQRAAASERLLSWERQRDAKDKERDKILLGTIDKTKLLNTAAIKQEAEIISQELSDLNEKIEYTKLLNEKLEADGKYWDDYIDLEQQKLQEFQAQQSVMEGRLILDYSDVEVARDEWKNESQKALIIKEEINLIREPKKQAKQKYTLTADVLRQRLAELKQKGVKNQLTYLLIKSQLRRYTALIQSIEKELQLLDAKKELAEIVALEKEGQFNIVDLRYRLRFESENLESLIAGFQIKKDIASSALKSLKERQSTAIASLIETNAMLDKVKATQEKIKNNRTFTSARLNESNEGNIWSLLEETKSYLGLQREFTQSFLATNAELITHQGKIINQYGLILSELEARQKIHNIWKRSPRAVSIEELSQSLLEAETFFKDLYWETPSQLKFSALVQAIKKLGLFDILILALFLLLYTVLFLVCRTILRILLKHGRNVLEKYQGHTRSLYIHLGLSMLNFCVEHYGELFTWFFLFSYVTGLFNYFFPIPLPSFNSYFTSVFYLISIPILIYFSRNFIVGLKELNKRLSYFFFAEALQDKFVLLISIFCYSTAIMIPLRMAILSHAKLLHSDLATVLFAAYTLILVIVVLFLFGKEDIVRFIPSHTSFFIWLKRKIDKNYYPVFFFFMGLFILANPYIGYSNMAWFLAFSVPMTALLLNMVFMVHYYVRKYSLRFFMREEDDELIDKFEYAKAYYGFFVIFSFLFLAFGTFLLVARIWGINYSQADLWKAMSEQWIVRFGVDSKVGLIELVTLGIFIALGFLASSLIHKFVLNRLFEILRSEPGTQNTISRISHYTTIFLAMFLGLNAINLHQFIFWVFAPFTVALALSLKEVVSDFVAGFFVLIERPIEIGNYIQIDDVQGTVHKISARSTTIITSKNHSVIVPNKDLVMKWIKNWGHGRFAIGFEIDIRVEQKTDPDLVRKILFSVVQAHPLILKVPGVVTRLENIEENALYFLVRAFISARRVKEQWEIAATIRSEILKAFKENNILLAKSHRLIEFASDTIPGNTGSPIEIKFDR